MKSRIYVLIVGLLLTTTFTNSFASSGDNNPRKDRIERPNEAARAEEIKTRVHEIRAMDKSTLTRSEKKALKKELRDLKKEARQIKGVYLSVGAIIIIILLLILIL